MRLDDDRTILEHLLSTLALCPRILDCALVAGHRYSSLAIAAESFGGKPTDCVLNPFFSASGPLGSIWIALSSTKSNYLVIANGDTVLYPNFSVYLDDTLERPEEGFFLLCSEATPNHEDAVNVIVRPDDCVIAVGKEVKGSKETLESSGVFVIAGQKSRDTFESTLHDLFTDSTDPIISWPWHAALNVLVADGHKVKVVRVPSSFWKEIDSAEDLAQLHQSQN